VNENDNALLVCMRVDELPTPPGPAHKSTCTECKAELWIAHTSPQDVPPYCYHCALMLAEVHPPDEIVLTTEDQARRFGFLP
jgi:hypothetical protein